MTQFPKAETNLMIDGPAGQLELLATPAKHDLERSVGVICHPHPQMQGTMHNKVVTTLAKAMDALGMPSVRFNFRGVGESAGVYDGGVGEVADALAVLRWANACYPNRAVWLAGFSFGGAIAYLAASQFSVAQLITIAPSVVHFDLQTQPQPTNQWLVVQGEADEVVPACDVIHWVNAFDNPPTLITIADCSHFFHGKLVILKQSIIETLS